MTRILVAAHNYPRFPADPAGAFVESIAHIFAERGCDVAVVAPHAPGAPSGRRSENGVEVTRFRYGPDVIETVAYSADMRAGSLLSPARLFPLPFFLRAFKKNLIGAVKRFRPDVIHGHWWFPCGWLARNIDVPLVVTCHGSDVRLIERSGVIRRMAKATFRAADVVTAVSRFLARDTERLTAMGAERVRVTHMPLDTRLWEGGTGYERTARPRILYAGNLVPSKGVDLIITAVKELTERGRDCEAKILGEGSARMELERLSDRLGLTDRVTFGDFVPQSTMPEEYGRSTISVLPTRGNAEGLGLTLAEALLSGCAVVGSPAGGIPEIIEDGQTGLIFRDGDASDLANKLGRLLDDPAQRKRMTARGRAKILARHSPESIHNCFEELYREAIDSHSHR